MGRRKRYDRDVLVWKALEVFRDRGFAGTSAEVLVERLGVNRYSLYAEFGNKQSLFDAVLRRYDREVLDRTFGPLETSEAGVDEIRAVLEFFGSVRESAAWGRGCLLCNTAVEFGPVDPGGGYARRYLARLSRAFRTALDNARDRGELIASADTAREAGFLTAAVLGLFVMLRAKAPAVIIRGASEAAIQHLRAVVRASC